MKIEIDQLVAFLGHSSIHDAFNDYLTRHGVKKRPKASDDYPYQVDVKAEGITLTFEDSPRKYEIATKSDGQFIFSEIYCDLESKKNPFKGNLPFGVNDARTSTDIIKRLGEPRSTIEGATDDGFGQTYFIDGLVCIFMFDDAAGSVMSFVRLCVPTKFDRQQGLAP
ncbi:hypothetical protein ACQ86G_22765 [Roseateles chitinivorans]|uniref:hypothetical protein n=1 Tax=Roseateles chitinivorans TaxID=2917965 RepID=UPI003D66A787